MGLSSLRSPSRQRHKRCDKYQESRSMPAEMDKNYPVVRRSCHAYEKSATALSVGIPRHNASAFGGGRMSMLKLFEQIIAPPAFHQQVGRLVSFGESLFKQRASMQPPFERQISVHGFEALKIVGDL